MLCLSLVLNYWNWGQHAIHDQDTRWSLNCCLQKAMTGAATSLYPQSVRSTDLSRAGRTRIMWPLPLKSTYSQPLQNYLYALLLGRPRLTCWCNRTLSCWWVFSSRDNKSMKKNPLLIWMGTIILPFCINKQPCAEEEGSSRQCWMWVNIGCERGDNYWERQGAYVCYVWCWGWEGWEETLKPPATATGWSLHWSKGERPLVRVGGTVWRAGHREEETGPHSGVQLSRASGSVSWRQWAVRASSWCVTAVGLLGDVKVKGSLGCSDHQVVEFMIFRRWEECTETQEAAPSSCPEAQEAVELFAVVAGHHLHLFPCRQTPLHYEMPAPMTCTSCVKLAFRSCLEHNSMSTGRASQSWGGAFHRTPKPSQKQPTSPTPHPGPQGSVKAGSTLLAKLKKRWMGS